jgi:hypothetical protein
LWFWLLRVRVPSVTPPRRGGTCVAKKFAMLNPAILESAKTNRAPSDFWLRLFNNEALSDCDDLEKLLVGCELIAALDAIDLLAA